VEDVIVESDLLSLAGLIAKLQDIQNKASQHENPSNFYINFNCDRWGDCDVSGFRLEVVSSRLESKEEAAARGLLDAAAKKKSELQAEELALKKIQEEKELFEELFKKYGSNKV